MAIVNHAKREINAKIVYFGPEGAGKGTSLRYVYDRIKPSLRGELKTLPTAGSTLLFFDFSPFEQPVFEGYSLRFHIYTLQGKVANPAAWKMTLKGTDGLVLVADASTDELPAAQQSLSLLRGFLNSYGVGLEDIPLVLQLNKADRAGRVATAETASLLGLAECSACLTTATSGDGVLEALTTLSRQIMERVRQRGDMPQNDAADSACGVKPDNDAIHPHNCTVHEVPMAADADAKVSVPDDEPPTACLSIDGGLCVSVAPEGVSVEGGTVRIPLELAQSGGLKRLMVTVTVGEV